MTTVATQEPVLRFLEFGLPWEDTKAGEAFANSRAKGEAGLPLYSVTMDRGLVPRDSLERHMHGDAADEKNLRAHTGDIVYNMMRMWQGAAGIAEVECMVSPAYVVLSPKVETSSEFFNYRIENARMLYLLWAYSHGLTSDRLRLYFADFARIPMLQPSLPEQKKIADFLGVVDAKIAALRLRQAGLERYKRGLMQALFSQRLRFTNPDGTPIPDWEEKRLGEVADCLDSKRKPLNKSERQLMQGEYPYYGANGQVDCISDYIFDEDIVLLAEDGGNFDEFETRPIAQRVTGKCWVNNHAHILTAKSGKVTHAFLFFALVHKDIRRYINGSSRAKLNKSDMLTIRMMLPHPDEQRQIAEALSAMDVKIQAVAGQIAQMEQFKKGLLQQMFV